MKPISRCAVFCFCITVLTPPGAPGGRIVRSSVGGVAFVCYAKAIVPFKSCIYVCTIKYGTKHVRC